MPKMMMNNETGVEEEVFTGEELKEQQEAAVKKYQDEHPDQMGTVTELQTKLKDAEDALGKAKDGDKNFAALRTAKEVAETKLKEFLGTHVSKSEVDIKIETAKKEVLEGVMKDHYNDTIGALAGEDEELKKKIEFNYKRLVKADGPATTKAEMNAKLQEAWNLSATPEQHKALNTSVISSGGVGRINVKGSDKKFTKEEKEMAQKMAAAGGMKLEEKDFDK